MSNEQSERQHQFLWLDLETTGLDPHAGKILEWAAVLAADDSDGDLTPVEAFSACVHVPRDVVLSLCDDFVRNMHTVNGLIDACETADTTLEAGEAFIIDLIGGPKTRGVILAGSSVHFDLGWLRVHMPKLAACLSHRVLDVSTLKIVERAYFDPGFSIEADRTPTHRALDDVLASLTAARAWHEAHDAHARKARAFDALCAETPAQRMQTVSASPSQWGGAK